MPKEEQDYNILGWKRFNLFPEVASPLLYPLHWRWVGWILAMTFQTTY